jgi:SAM-dependent methyltransferase
MEGGIGHCADGQMTSEDNHESERGVSAKSSPHWENIHKRDASWRKQLIGDISDVFVVPRYVKLFYDTFGHRRDQDFFEVGSGNGDMSVAIQKANRGQIRRYVVSDYFAESVAWLRELGLEAMQADAQALPCGDGEYDAVIDFDVMHHVDRPRDMALEMMRVGRGRALLVESNGLSFPRRLLELTPGHRAAGERSYTPRAYKSFFEGHPGFRLTGFNLYPFLFPFKCPRWFLPVLVWFNHHVENIPLFRWQCSSVVIYVEYERE